ncbi:hypothetical protein ZIOFF_055767 [Zingiber officinale]|uniref:mitogen-activated protein kinase kinase n=1 Tax=Zingiber officinale TaxID=94328 RepID=A0A8J5FCM1_ZINOF|nr:hypothetical protein ZIOFF_055767 [Zingiber officinale]
MKKTGPGNLKLKLSLPRQEESIGKFLTQSGTFKDGNLLVNKDGLRIVSESEEGGPPLIKPLDNTLSLDDLDAVKVVGKGSGGIVQLVRHKWTSQFFALKVIQMNIQEDIRKQIAQELRISLATQCPFVVQCYQCFYDNGVISIVLEYMDGGSLADFLKSVRTIPEPYLAAICNQASAHCEVKISDFGVSVIIASSSGQRDTFTGTYNYMSPERITGQKHGPVSDIWSLGLIMLECATGQFPYPPRDSFYELLEEVVERPSPFAPSDQFSAEFSSFISECLQKKPMDRKPAQALLAHPFLSMYADLNIDLASYFTTAGSPLATF